MMGGEHKKIRYRLATSIDAPDIARLRWQLKTDDGLLDSASRQDQFVSEFVQWNEKACNQQKLVHWVAESDGKLLAVMSVIIVDKVAAPERMSSCWGYLTNCYALPEIRNDGVGTHLGAGYGIGQAEGA